jgi:hypothetical protein
VLLVICPYQFQLHSPRTLRRPQDRLIQFAKSVRMHYVDLLPAFAEFTERNPQIDLFVDGNHFANHFSIAGHKLAADSLVDPVTQVMAEVHSKQGS